MAGGPVHAAAGLEALQRQPTGSKSYSRRGTNSTLSTTLGYLDLLGEITGGGACGDLLGQSEPVALFGHTCRLLRLDALIRVRRAAGRPRDFEAVAELEVLLDERAQR